MMPERMAKTPASEQIKEYIGSGPFIFKRDEWVSGAKAVYVKNADYVPRQEKPEYFSGRQGGELRPRRVDRAARSRHRGGSAADRRGGLAGVPVARPAADAAQVDRAATWCVTIRSARWRSSRSTICIPPFDNPKLLRALLPAIDQKEYVTAWVGEQQDLGTYPVGLLHRSCRRWRTTRAWTRSPSPRDLAKAKKLVAESGYKGEKIVMMAPSDQPSLVAPSQVSRDLFIKLGLNVDYQVMDWGTLVARRAKMDPPSQGGWNVFHTTWGGLATSNPGSSYPLRGNGKKPAGSAGRPMPRWRHCAISGSIPPTSPSRRRSASRSSCRRSRDIPFMPVGQWYYPWAIRKDLTDFVQCAAVLFWGVQARVKEKTDGKA